MFSDREQNIFYPRIERFLVANRKLLHGSFYENEWIVTVILYYCFSIELHAEKRKSKTCQGTKM